MFGLRLPPRAKFIFRQGFDPSSGPDNLDALTISPVGDDLLNQLQPIIEFYCNITWKHIKEVPNNIGQNGRYSITSETTAPGVNYQPHT